MHSTQKDADSRKSKHCAQPTVRASFSFVFTDCLLLLHLSLLQATSSRGRLFGPFSCHVGTEATRAASVAVAVDAARRIFPQARGGAHGDPKAEGRQVGPLFSCSEPWGSVRCE